MIYEPIYLNRWTMPDNYFGAEWPNYFGSGVGQSRDSDALERSNFACMLAALGGESETVRVIQESHWAVGWVEWIAIHESDAKALQIADEIVEALQDYPVIDESDFSEREWTEAGEVWQQCFDETERIRMIRKHRSDFEFYDFKDMIGSIRGKWYCGLPEFMLH